jgi:uncharacterized protein (TIGR03083 family)
VEPTAYLEAIRTESAALVAAAGSAGMDAAVPSCPDWNIGELLVHVGIVQRWAADHVVERRTERQSLPSVDPPADPIALVEWVRSGSAQLVAALEATPPGTEMWTFAGPGSAAFWFRRQAQEIAMHRVDAELASGVPAPIESDLAYDGINEFFDVIVPLRLRDRLVGNGQTLHFHRTDGDGEWLVRLTADGPEVEHAHAKGDVAVRGGASDLLMVIRGRIGLETVEVFGDTGLIDLWLDLSRV